MKFDFNFFSGAPCLRGALLILVARELSGMNVQAAVASTEKNNFQFPSPHNQFGLHVFSVLLRGLVLGFAFSFPLFSLCLRVSVVDFTIPRPP